MKRQRSRNTVQSRSVMIPALDPDLESDLQLFGDSRSGFGSNKNLHHNTSLEVLGLDVDPVSDLQSFGNSESGFRYSKKWNRNTSSSNQIFATRDPLLLINLLQIRVDGQDGPQDMERN